MNELGIQLMLHNIIKHSFLLLTILFYGCAACSQNGVPIIWHDTSAFDRQAEQFLLSSKEALEQVRLKTSNCNNCYYDKYPYFIVDGYYFFGLGEKTYIPLEGYYVNGNTGEVQYRYSKTRIRGSTKYLPENAYSRIDILP
jgi:hypothetical protein